MLKDIVSIDPLFGFTSNNYQVDPSISGQVCYDHYQLIKKMST
jgi:hypothetical protein